MWTLWYVKFDISLHIHWSSEGLAGEDTSLRECEIVLCNSYKNDQQDATV